MKRKSRGRPGRAYRHYVAASLQQGRRSSNTDSIHRLPAPALEHVVGEALTRWLPEQVAPLQHLVSVRIMASGLAIELGDVRPGLLAHRLADGEKLVHREGCLCTVRLGRALPLRGGCRRIVPAVSRGPQPDPTLIAALRKAHALLDHDRGKPILAAAPVSPYLRRLLRLAFLAPDIQRAILAGRQPLQLNLEAIMAREIPLAWSAQRLALGFV